MARPRLGSRGGDCLYLRGKSWVLDFRHRGNRHVKTLGPFPSRSAARQAAAIVRAKILAGEAGIASRQESTIRLGQAVSHFLNSLKGDVRKSTITRYEVSFRALMAFFGEDRILMKIDAWDLEQYRRVRLEAGVSVGFNRDMECLRNLYNRAIGWGWLRENPVRHFKRVKESRGRTRWLTQEELQRLLDSSSPQLRWPVVMAAMTGLRMGEVLRLKVGDIDRMRGMVMVQAGSAKTREYREVPVYSALLPLLEHLMAGRDAAEPLFLNSRGKPYRSMRTALATALRNAGIKNLTPHDLRHTFASHLMMQGADIGSLMEMLGHRSMEMTKRYAHLSQDHKREAIERLGSQLLGKFTADFTTVSANGNRDSQVTIY